MITVDKAVDHIFRWLVTLVMVALVVFFSFALMRTAGFVAVDSQIIASNNTPEYAMGGIQGESILIQTFIASKPVNRIGIRMATYDRENPGELYIRIFSEESGETVSQSILPAADLIDNDFNIFQLDQVIPADGNIYAMEISGTSPNVLQSVGVWCSHTDTYPDGTLTVNEFETDGDLVFLLAGPKYQSTVGPVGVMILLTTLILMCITGWILFIRHENRRRS